MLHIHTVLSSTPVNWQSETGHLRMYFVAIVHLGWESIQNLRMYIKDHQINKIIFCCTVNDIPTSLHHANQTAALSMHTGSSTTHSIQPNSITS